MEDALDKALPLEAVETALGLTKLEQSLNLLGGCSKDGVLQYVGKLIKHLEDTLGVVSINRLGERGEKRERERENARVASFRRRQKQNLPN